MALRSWSFHIHDRDKGQFGEPTSQAGFINICTAGVVTGPTVYLDERGSTTLTKTNVINTAAISEGKYTFWTLDSVESLDISFITDAGECGVLKAATSSNHFLPIYSTYMGVMQFWQPIYWIGGTSVNDTGVDIPDNLVISDAALYIDVVDSAKTLDVGFLNSGESGDEDGLLDGMLLTTAGWLRPNLIATAGGTQDHGLATNGKRGALLGPVIVGANTSDKPGGDTKSVYNTDGTIKSLTYTHDTADTFEGFIILDINKTMGN